MTTLLNVTETSDTDLVGRSLAGDREAFSQIVLRYQTLICSLAYSILGNLGESEDAAQETFIVAWKRLRHLREPSKLRSWLCGIVNNRARDSLRRDGRQAIAGAESIEESPDIASFEALPSETAISNEEQAILWRALCRVPEVYREPLILYYREQHSVQRVASSLELSEDAVKQRLSRGRKLLHQEVIDFVEDALTRTAPRESFTANVLSALPLGPGLVGSGGLTAAVGKSTAAKSGGLLAVITGSVASLAGVFAGIAAQWQIVQLSRSKREKQVKVAWFSAVWVFVALAWVIPPGLRAAARSFGWSDQTLAVATMANWWVYAGVFSTLAIVAFRWIFARRREAAAQRESAEPLPGRQWPRRLALISAVYVANVYWLLALAWRAEDIQAVATVTTFTLALAVWHFTRLAGKNRDEALTLAVQHVGMLWGAMLLTLTLCLDRWQAGWRGIDLAQWHQLQPAWVVPTLSLALVVWVGATLKLTGPKAIRG